MKRPQLWFETWSSGGCTDTTLRIFYPDGTSEYLNLNRYYDNGDVLIRHSPEWQDSCGDDWHPDMEYGSVPYTDNAEFLGYL